MSDSASLKFDKMEVDTSLAKEYFKKKKHTFTGIHIGEPVQNTESTKCILDQCNNKVYCTVKEIKFYLEPSIVKLYNWTSPGDSLWQLAKKIEENGELFCQLHHAATSYSIEDIRNCDLPLLINKCLNLSSLMDKYSMPTAKEVRGMRKISWDRPLLYLLSRAVSYVWSGSRVLLSAPPQMAAVCTLFLDMCAQVGLHHHVSLWYYDETSESDVGKGCIGVVSETADLDSAVHAFVSSTTEFPWGFKILLIQESVYEEFQRALVWKCNVNGSEDQKLDPQVKQACADVQVARGKIFLMDHVGSDVTHPELQPVLVSAYRTTKELLSIMSKYKEYPFMSLWCGDAAQAHEIAFSISTPCVWINDYAVFKGPAQVSSAVPPFPIKEKMWNAEALEMAAAPWLKLDLEKRREVVLGTLHKYLTSAKRNDQQLAVRVQILLRTQKPGFVDVQKNHMWLGIESHVGFVIFKTGDPEFLACALASTVYGNSLVMFKPLAEDSLVKVMQEAGVPIFAESGSCDLTLELYSTRAVYTNFGTIFAN